MFSLWCLSMTDRYLKAHRILGYRISDRWAIRIMSYSLLGEDLPIQADLFKVFTKEIMNKIIEYRVNLLKGDFFL